MPLMETLAPVALIGILAILLLPLPPMLMDLLLSFNLVLAMVILLATVYLTRPLELSVFPSLLLLVTFFRLALNVATTRLILSNAGERGLGAAGGVVRAFGEFVAGHSPLVGFVIFLLLIVIQFVVITKGATRISEVAARFMLDGLPGKQMSIDGDLSSGLITHDQARARRQQLTREVDFYGAMDGASRWIRGDAIAALIIVLVNILGGLAMGLFYYSMRPSEAFAIFTLLTIGDGLVTQIPAVIIAIAAGLLITRASSPMKLGATLARELLFQPRLLLAGVVFLGVFALLPVPKLPILILLAFGGIGVWLVYRYRRESTPLREEQNLDSQDTRARTKPQSATSELQEVPRIYPLELEIGYRLVGLTGSDSEPGVAQVLTNVRQELATQLGFLIPAARIRDNLNLPPDGFQLKLRGLRISQGRLPTDKVLLAGEPDRFGELEGERCELAGLPQGSIWLETRQQERAELAGLRVMMPVEALAHHLRYLFHQRAHQLLARRDVSKLLERVKQESPSLVEELIPSLLTLGQVHSVLKNLLEEGIPIHDLEAILEALSEGTQRTKDPELLTELVRAHLGEVITARDLASDGRLYALTLEPALEDLLNGALADMPTGRELALPPAAAAELIDALSGQLGQAEAPAGVKVVLLSSPHIRRPLKKALEKPFPQLAVVGYSEIAPTLQVQSVGTIALPPGEVLDELSQHVAALAHWSGNTLGGAEQAGLLEVESRSGVTDAQ